MRSGGVRRRRTAVAAALLAAAATTAVGCATQQQTAAPAHARLEVASYVLAHRHAHPLPAAARRGITKIRHVVIVTQENRSFDSYFGTYPGADGFPRPVRKICVPDLGGTCHHPYHTRADVTASGPHSYADSVSDVNGGKMNGFIQTSERAHSQCQGHYDPNCSKGAAGKMVGYYDNREIPDYWRLARHYVLQDHFFEATNSWSFPEHLYEVSGWSAFCGTHAVTSCRSDRDLHRELRHPGKLILAWTDITYLLHAYGVSWRYYVEPGYQPDCENPHQIECPPARQNPRSPSVWNPLPQFETVQQDRQVRDVQSTQRFFTAARQGRLPDVSWVVPNFADSDHPPARVRDGQAWVAKVVDAVMSSRDWKSTAIFVSWDDWGGFYDHVKPPDIDRWGWGIRVPGLVISPYAVPGKVDHQLLSSDAYLKFIEDRWLGGQALDPSTDGRWDPRPDTREAKKRLGDLLNDFDFRRAPRAPRPQPLYPRTDLVEPGG